jgi:hypothetical protein
MVDPPPEPDVVDRGQEFTQLCELLTLHKCTRNTSLDY